MRFAPLSLTLLLTLLTGLPTLMAQGGRGGPASVGVTEVLESDGWLSRAFLGTTEPIKRTAVGSAIDGRVEYVMFEEGEEITDQLPGRAANISEIHEVPPMPNDLVRLKMETITQDVLAARAQLDVLTAAKEELEASLPAELASLKATRDAAAATAELAQKNYERVKALYDRNRSISQSEFDQASSDAAISASRLDEAESNLLKADKTQQARLDQAKAMVKAQEAEVKKLEDQRFKHVMRSPFPGYVIVSNVEVGDWVSRGDVVAEVINIDTIELKVFVPEENIHVIQQAMKESKDTPTGGYSTMIRVAALQGAATDDPSTPAREDQGEFLARVVRIVPQADPKSRTFPVIVHVDNPVPNQVDSDETEPRARLLGSGMLAEVPLPIGLKEKRLFVPKDAVNINGRYKSVMKVVTLPDGSQSAQEIAVDEGLRQGDYVSITVTAGQLAAGDQIVIEGNERLRPNQPVTAQPSTQKLSL